MSNEKKKKKDFFIRIPEMKYNSFNGFCAEFREFFSAVFPDFHRASLNRERKSSGSTGMAKAGKIAFQQRFILTAAFFPATGFPQE